MSDRFKRKQEMREEGGAAEEGGRGGGAEEGGTAGGEEQKKTSVQEALSLSSDIP